MRSSEIWCLNTSDCLVSICHQVIFCEHASASPFHWTNGRHTNTNHDLVKNDFVRTWHEIVKRETARFISWNGIAYTSHNILCKNSLHICFFGTVQPIHFLHSSYFPDNIKWMDFHLKQRDTLHWTTSKGAKNFRMFVLSFTMIG